MVKFNPLEGHDVLLKYTTSEQTKCTPFSFQGIKIPIYRLGGESLLDNGSFCGVSCILEDEQSTLDSLLLAQWEDRMLKGYFKYDVTTSEIKAIRGRRRFLAQLNEGCINHLPKSEEKKNHGLGEPFAFDQMKHHEELLFCVSCGDKTNSEFIPSADVPNGSIVIVINATPVEYGHVFLVPYASNSIPQFLDAKSLEMFARIAVEINNCSLRLFYDCSSHASHLYFQACYFSNPLPVELMPIDTFFCDGQRGIHISTVIDYPIKTLLFESNHNYKMLVEVLTMTCCHLQKMSIPYNLLISDCGKKFFLFLQAQTPTSSSILSAWECGGYFWFKSRSEYEEATEDSMLKRLTRVSVDDGGFQIVKQLSCSIASKLAI